MNSAWVQVASVSYALAGHIISIMNFMVGLRGLGGSDAGVGFLESGDVELPHLEHGFGGALRLRGVLVIDHAEERARDDLPRQAELVLEPAAHALLAAVGDELRPVL